MKRYILLSILAIVLGGTVASCHGKKHTTCPAFKSKKGGGSGFGR